MMDNEQERNEHFKGFAQLTLQKLMNKYDHLPPGEWGPAESDEIILAQCAYDLVYHAVSQLNERANTNLTNIKAWIDLGIPDLTEWPKTVLE